MLFSRFSANVLIFDWDKWESSKQWAIGCSGQAHRNLFLCKVFFTIYRHCNLSTEPRHFDHQIEALGPSEWKKTLKSISSRRDGLEQDRLWKVSKILISSESSIFLFMNFTQVNHFQNISFVLTALLIKE